MNAIQDIKYTYWNEVDGGTIEGGVGAKNTWDGIVVGLGVVTDDSGVDEEGQECVLIGSIIFL